VSRHYLDHASTSPLRAEALAAMVEWWESGGGDPGRIHHEGMAARVAVEDARDRVAAALGARPREVVFTSGATESIAAASFGAARSRGTHSVLSGVEHSAVREWAARGDQTLVPVDGVGRVDVDAMGDVVGDDTGIVHCQWGNHEVGTLQPVEAVVAAVDGRTPVHSDAAAAVGHVPIAFDESGVDLMSVSAHKFGGPTGAGALLVRRGLRVDPLLVGGDQERARRAGMEDVAAVVGFAAGLDAAVAAMDEESARSRDLTDRVVEWAATFDGVAVVGDPADRLPHIICLTIDGIEPQPVLLGLDQAGVAVHSGSSCSSESIEPSPVLAAMGVDAQRSLRVSVGWSSTDGDVDRLLEALPRIIGELRSLRG
jgi:cysteine desulfurase